VVYFALDYQVPGLFAASRIVKQHTELYLGCLVTESHSV
jgi:hypothetical protein